MHFLTLAFDQTISAILLLAFILLRYLDFHLNVSTFYLSYRSYQSEYLNNGPQQIGRKYKKVRFMPYTDETFKTHETVQYESGILGPLLYGEVGDTLLVSCCTYLTLAKKKKPEI